MLTGLIRIIVEQQTRRLVETAFAGCELPGPSDDPYEVLLLRLKQEFVPLTVLWEVTHKCNLDCIMCYNVPLGQSELTTSECFNVLDQLAASGTLYLTFTGGEILSRRDFFEIAQYARSLGFALSLKTNGTLITPDKADQIASLDPLRVDISLLGATDETFDVIARKQGYVAASGARYQVVAGTQRQGQAHVTADGPECVRA